MAEQQGVQQSCGGATGQCEREAPRWLCRLFVLYACPSTCVLTHPPAAFALWAPRLYQYYHDHNTALHRRHPDMRRPFGHSVFFCAAFNFGPNVWTFCHHIVLNLVFGWCAIQALGEFDPTKGGHLVLWDLNLIVEFPPGALILLPSATLVHSNVPVAPGEKRASFTQFSAGSIF
jgi:hypothetical protein